jgi:DNA-binding response OmpR family regulator
VIDDEASDREMMADLLQREGYTVLEANAYEDALLVFRRNREIVDLIVSDISLPGGNGCELAIAMRKQKTDVQMLFVSGHVGAEVCRFYGLELSDLHFLRITFSTLDLLSRARRILNCTAAFPELKDEQAQPQINARP